MSDNRFSVIAVLIITLLAIYIAVPLENKPFFGDKKIKQGIDLQGGAEIVVRLVPEEATESVNLSDEAQKTKEVLQRRINLSGLKEPNIRVAGDNQIFIQLPGFEQDEIDDVTDIIKQSGNLTFHLEADSDTVSTLKYPKTISGYRWVEVGESRIGSGYWNEDKGKGHILLKEAPVLSGEDVARAIPQPNPEQLKSYLVEFTLKAASAADFADMTGNNINTRMAIILDGRLISAPVIRGQIGGGKGVIEGDFTQKSAHELAVVLSSGSLPVPIDIAYQNFVGPSLGHDSIRRGMWACGLGLGLVVLFMILYYRGAGIVSALAVIVNLALIMAIMTLFEATLTLAGIAGLILTVGMAVDANILIYERIREERDRGKTALQAFDHGFDRAYWTIFDANITTLIAALVLYYVGTDAIKGFGVTLSIGILTTLFTALFMTKVVLASLVRGNIIKDFKMFAMFKDSKFNFLGMAKPFMAVSVIAIIVGLGVFGSRGNDMLGLDFTGGSMVNVQLLEEMDIEDFRSEYSNQLVSMQTSDEDGKSVAKYPDVGIQTVVPPGGNLVAESVTRSDQFQIRVRNDDIQELENDLRTILGDKLPARGFEDPVAIDGKFDKFAGGSIVVVHLHPNHPKTLEEISSALTEKFGTVGEDFEVVAVEGADASAPVIGFGLRTRTSIDDQAGLRRNRDRLKHIEGITIAGSPFPVSTSIGGSAAADLTSKAFTAILFACILMVLYIGVRFRSLKYGFAAIVALIHDVCFALGTVAVIGMLIPREWGLNFDLSLASVAAFLTVIGYSINDTIVVFDRIRENLIVNKHVSFRENVNISINQNLSRTILTSLTTFIVVSILYVITMRSGGGIADFAFPMIIGVVVGTYSSIYIAAPIMAGWFGGAEEESTASA